MSGAALTCLVLVGGFVWGGFVALLARAVRREAGKGGTDAEATDGS